jgi:hypothetical protein
VQTPPPPVTPPTGTAPPTGTSSAVASTSGVILADAGSSGTSAAAGTAAAPSPQQMQQVITLINTILTAVLPPNLRNTVSLTAAGDLNGDGVVDFVLSFKLGKSSGVIIAISGLTGQPLFVVPTGGATSSSGSGLGAVRI